MVNGVSSNSNSYVVSSRAAAGKVTKGDDQIFVKTQEGSDVSSVKQTDLKQALDTRLNDKLYLEVKGEAVYELDLKANPEVKKMLEDKLSATLDKNGCVSFSKQDLQILKESTIPKPKEPMPEPKLIDAQAKKNFGVDNRILISDGEWDDGSKPGTIQAGNVKRVIDDAIEQGKTTIELEYGDQVFEIPLTESLKAELSSKADYYVDYGGKSKPNARFGLPSELMDKIKALKPSTEATTIQPTTETPTVSSTTTTTQAAKKPKVDANITTTNVSIKPIDYDIKSFAFAYTKKYDRNDSQKDNITDGTIHILDQAGLDKGFKISAADIENAMTQAQANGNQIRINFSDKATSLDDPKSEEGYYVIDLNVPQNKQMLDKLLEKARQNDGNFSAGELHIDFAQDKGHGAFPCKISTYKFNLLPELVQGNIKRTEMALRDGKQISEPDKLYIAYKTMTNDFQNPLTANQRDILKSVFEPVAGEYANVNGNTLIDDIRFNHTTGNVEVDFGFELSGFYRSMGIGEPIKPTGTVLGGETIKDDNFRRDSVQALKSQCWGNAQKFDRTAIDSSSASEDLKAINMGSELQFVPSSLSRAHSTALQAGNALRDDNETYGQTVGKFQNEYMNAGRTFLNQAMTTYRQQNPDASNQDVLAFAITTMRSFDPMTVSQPNGQPFIAPRQYPGITFPSGEREFLHQEEEAVIEQVMFQQLNVKANINAERNTGTVTQLN